MIQQFFNRLGYYKPRKRKFAGADTGRLFHSWAVTNYSADSELRKDLRTLRSRSRELANNNDYAKKFFRMVKTNVVGQKGIRLQSMAMQDNNQPDDKARKKIEDGFLDWSRRGVCDITGKYSFRDIQNLVISSVARDGEALIRYIRGVDNEHGFSLQLIEADHLDDMYNDKLANGNKVKMGIELDEWSRPVAYWVYPVHPGDLLYGQTFHERVRIPAEDLIHIYLPYRISQSRGLPWLHSAMTRLNMIGEYEKAELIAARLGAAKNGFYYSDGGGEYVGDDVENGSPIQDAEPGHYELLPPGMKFESNNPDHPTTAYKDFIKTILRGISSGVDVSYNYLGNDLENVNYSSIRAGVLDERDVWRDLQAWLSEHFLQVVFEEWLSLALLKQSVKLQISKIDYWKSAKWQARGWQWVDPLKDAMSSIEEIKAGLKTASMVAAEKGLDLEEVYAELAREKDLQEKYGIKVSYDLDALEVLAKIQEILSKIEDQNEKN
jgi:lambda family phage portal protein